MSAPTLTKQGERDAHAPVAHPHAAETNTGISNAKLAMWLFLASECLLFGALITTFLLYKDKTNGGPPFHGDGGLFDIPFTSLSSFILLMSSLTMVLAVSAIERRDPYRMRVWLAATALLGSVFIAGQIYEFTSFVREGVGYTDSPAASSFYTLTGLHGIHVTIGILILVSMLALSLRGKLPEHHSETVEVAGLYWHFVDVVWILIFAVVYLIP